MVGRLLVRGMAAGLVAGLITFCFARIAGEPLVDTAIAFEEQLDAAKEAAQTQAQTQTQAHDAHDTHGMQGMSHEHEPELVSRDTQAGLGLFTGVMVYGAAIGGLFSLVFAYARGRTSKLGERALSAWLALAAFVSIVIVPNIKYPANPPAIGNPETLGARTGLFFLMIAISITVMVLGLNVRRRAAMRFGPWNGSIIAGLVFIAILAIIQNALPVVSEVPADFPAAVLWKFRLVALGMQAILWATIGLLFGALAERYFSVGQPGRAMRPAAF